MSRLFRSVLTAVLVSAALPATSVPASAAESAVLKGTVVDFSGTAIKKVSVVLTSADDSSVRHTAKSDKNGRFEISVEDASLSYKAQLVKNGYAGFELAVEFSAGETTERTFTMLTEQEIAEGKAEIVRRRENPAKFAAMDSYNEGVKAFSAGDTGTAREHFETALEHEDSMIQALSAMCVITMQEQEWDDAKEYATRALTIEPTNLPALFASYRANKVLGHDAEAAAAAEVLKSTGNNVDAAGQLYNEGVGFYQKRKVDQAVPLFEQAVELNPTLTDAHVALAGLYLGKGDFDKALAASDRALALAPDDKRALKTRFEACLRSDNDQLPGAIEALGAVDLPYVSRVVNERAFDLFERNQYDQSRNLVEQLLAADPEDARANYVMGLILVNAGDNDAARKHLQAFVDAAPDDPDAAGARAMMEAIQ
jgi:tetratricopeptide (TPR) repeat protein